jgi:hypothetical protein
LGYFIQIYNPTVDRYIQLGHLSEIASTIPFSPPQKDGNDWRPTNHTISVSDLKNHPQVVKVKRGDYLGRVGVSGLGWGYEEYDENKLQPQQLDEKDCPSFDEPHLHFEECFRDQETNKKGWQRDPYDLYLRARNYPTHMNNRTMGIEPLFIISEEGKPEFSC